MYDLIVTLIITKHLKLTKYGVKLKPIGKNRPTNIYYGVIDVELLF